MALLPESLNGRLVLAAKFSPPELENEVKQMPGWDRVDFVGWRPKEEVAALLGQSRMGLVLFHPYPIIWMHSRISCLITWVPVFRSLPLTFPCGARLFEEGSVSLLIRWIHRRLPKRYSGLWEHPVEAHEMGLRGKQAAISCFNWDNEKTKLLDLYRGLLCFRAFNFETSND